jgi:hypothetical protein
VFGNEILTDAQPNPRWAVIGNYWPDPDPTMIGDVNSVTFPQYGTYPVTLIVTDNAGFPSQITKFIQVTQAVKCLKLFDYNLEPFPNSKKIYKLRLSTNPTCFNYHDIGDYFQWDDNFCINNYSGTCSWDPSCCNDCAITNAKWTLKDNNNNVISIAPYAMPIGGYTYWYEWWAYQSPSPRLFSSTIPHKGKYTLTLEAWNYVTCPSCTGTPATKANYHMYDALIADFIVVDCNENIDVEQDIPSGPHETEYSGSFTFAQTHSVNVTSGADIAYEANSSLIMSPGFTASYGSSFRATVEEILSKKDDICELWTQDSDIKEKNNFQIYPNPNSGTFYIKGIPESNLISKITILNGVGVICDSYISYRGHEAYVSINNAVSGMYILNIVNDKNQTFKKKILVVK